MEQQTHIPPKSRMKPNKGHNVPFSHPWDHVTQAIGHFRLPQSEVKCEAVDMAIIYMFYSHANKTHFHQKVLHSLALKVRVFEPTAYWKYVESNVNEVSFCFLRLVSRWGIGALTRVKLEIGLINRPVFMLRPAYTRQGQTRTQEKEKFAYFSYPCACCFCYRFNTFPSPTPRAT